MTNYDYDYVETTCDAMDAASTPDPYVWELPPRGPLAVHLSADGVLDIDGNPQGAARAQAFGRLVRAIAANYPDALAANGYWHDGRPPYMHS